MDEEISIGIVGVGYWGPNYVRVCNEIPGIHLKYICDLDQAKLNRLSSKDSSIRKTRELKDLLEDKDLKAVVIATPTKTHYRLVKTALEAGKHVLVEKPLCTSSKEVEELIKIAEKKRLKLMVGHIFEYNSVVQKIKELIDSKSCGDILYIHCSRTGLGPIRDDVNAVWDLATHDISILLYLIGKKPLNVVAKGASYINRPIEDIAFATIEFENKVIANIHVSWLDPIKIRTMTIVGTEKMIVFDDISQIEKLKIFDKGISYENPGGTFSDFQASVRDGDILIPKIKMKEPLKEQFSHFIDCIKNDKKPLTDGNNGLNVVKVLEAIDESLKTNNKVQIR